jgi:hypothetical protein
MYNVGSLHVGWYSDWTYRANPDMPADQDIEYAQLIRVKGTDPWTPNWTQIQEAVEQNLGSLWMIGNEPECPNQDSVTPEQYADRYHQAYTQIKTWDPTAQIAIGAIVEPTPLRFLWLERAMDAYEQTQGLPMPVDVWNIHMQILPEGSYDGMNPNAGAGIPVGIDPAVEGVAPELYELADSVNQDLFKQMVTDFRQWMKDNGQQNRPLTISEMGVLQPSIYLVEGGSEAERQERGDQAIEDFIVDIFDWLIEAQDQEIGYLEDDNLLVQRWLWFSLNGSFWDENDNPRGFNGSLYDYRTQKLTRFGRALVAPYQIYEVVLPVVSR